MEWNFDNVTFNGQDLDRVQVNGVTVWEKIKFYDYLVSDGKSYIDTEVIGSDDISTDLKFTNLGASNKFVCGGTSVYTPVIVQSNNWFNTRYQPINSGVITTVLTQADQNEHTIKFNFNHSITWDGIEYASNLSLQTDNRTILLFGSQTGTQYNATIKLYYCKMYNNGVLIRDFKPCKYAGQYGLWDLVNNKFYGNANSSGAFTVGGEIKYYDYLQGDATAYIDTDYIANSETELRFKYNTQLTTSISCLFSSRQKYATRDISYFPTANGATKPQIVFGSYGLASGSSIVPSETAEVIMKKTLIKYNNLQFTFTASSFTCPDNLLLFKNSPSSTYNGRFGGKLYYFKIYDNGTLVRDFKPCLYGGEAGLWDSVENKFYGNANSTGTFSVGNE